MRATGQYNDTLDIPVDQQRELQPSGDEGPIKIWTNYLSHNSTFPAYRIIYLQRLADPTRPWFPAPTGTSPQQWNPYRTVDAMTVDLTTFNGLTPAEPTPIDPASLGRRRHSRPISAARRTTSARVTLTLPPNRARWISGSRSRPTRGLQSRRLATPGWTATASGATPQGHHYFSQPLNQTLGYLNQPMAAVRNPFPAGRPAIPVPAG